MASVFFDPAVGGDASTVTDDSSPTTGLDNGGHRTRFVPALAQIVAIAQNVVAKAAAAAASAASALNAPGTNATSTSSLTIGTGAISLTLAQTGKAFSVGQSVNISRTSAPATTAMWGIITAFNSGTGAMTVQVPTGQTLGSGTFTDWTISLTASGTGVAGSRQVTGGGLATGGGDLTADRVITVTAATGANVHAGTSTAVAVTPKALADAMPPVSVSYAASISLDLSTGLNFDLGALTGNLVLANFTNAKVGQSGRIRIPQDATGGRTISYGTNFKAPGGPQALSTPASAVDLLVYYVRDASTVEYTLLKALS